MAAGTTLLFASLLVFNPIKAVLAFGFSHLFEYFVFVWAYERRRYCAPLSHRPPLACLLRHPAVAYPLFLLIVGGAFFLFTNWGTHIFRGSKPPRGRDGSARISWRCSMRSSAIVHRRWMHSNAPTTSARR